MSCNLWNPEFYRHKIKETSLMYSILEYLKRRKIRGILLKCKNSIFLSLWLIALDLTQSPQVTELPLRGRLLWGKIKIISSEYVGNLRMPPSPIEIRISEDNVSTTITDNVQIINYLLWRMNGFEMMRNIVNRMKTLILAGRK